MWGFPILLYNPQIYGHLEGVFPVILKLSSWVLLITRQGLRTTQTPPSKCPWIPGKKKHWTLVFKIYRDFTRSTEISQDLPSSHKIYRDLTRSTEISQDLPRFDSCAVVGCSWNRHMKYEKDKFTIFQLQLHIYAGNCIFDKMVRILCKLGCHTYKIFIQGIHGMVEWTPVKTWKQGNIWRIQGNQDMFFVFLFWKEWLCERAS